MNSDCQLIYERYRVVSRQLIFEKYQNAIITTESLDSGAMTVEQLKDYLLTIKRPTPVTVEIESPARMRKTGNPYNGAIKRSIINGMAGGDYEISMQNRELAAHADDDNYEATLRAASLWNGKGKRISPLVIQHIESGEYYLAIGNPRSGTSTYMFEGQPIEKSALSPFLIAPSVSQKQTSAGIAAENTIQPRYPLLKNIKNIKINNVNLQIT